MNMICPNCGYCRPSAGYAEELSRLPLGRRELDIVLRLSQAAGAYVSPESLIDFIYGDDEDGGPLCAATAITAFISSTRKKLASTGWEIEYTRSRGYRLVKE